MLSVLDVIFWQKMGYVNWTIGATSALQSGMLGDAPRRLAWNVPPEELIYIPDHWFSFAEPPASLHFLMALLYLGYFVFGMIGNLLVIWIFSSVKSLRSASNMFVVNLAICDTLMTIKAPITVYNSFYGGFTLGHMGCQIIGFFGSLSGIGQGMTNAFIAYDRYNTITRPFDGKLSKTKAFLMIVIIWAYTIPWAVFPLTETWNRFVPEGFLTTCTFDYLTNNYDVRVFVASIFTCSYCIPIVLIIFYYSRIVNTVFSHEKALREQAKKMKVDSLRSNQQQSNESAEVRITKAAITMCFLFIVAWTPYAVLALIGVFGDQRLLTPGVTMIPACTCKLVACIDPYVYAISHPRYRAELQKKVPWLGIKETSINAPSTGTTATQENQHTTTA